MALYLRPVSSRNGESLTGTAIADDGLFRRCSFITSGVLLKTHIFVIHECSRSLYSRMLIFELVVGLREISGTCRKISTLIKSSKTLQLLVPNRGWELNTSASNRFNYNHRHRLCFFNCYNSIVEAPLLFSPALFNHVWKLCFSIAITEKPLLLPALWGYLEVLTSQVLISAPHPSFFRRICLWCFLVKRALGMRDSVA